VSVLKRGVVGVLERQNKRETRKTERKCAHIDVSLVFSRPASSFLTLAWRGVVSRGGVEGVLERGVVGVLERGVVGALERGVVCVLERGVVGVLERGCWCVRERGCGCDGERGCQCVREED